MRNPAKISMKRLKGPTSMILQGDASPKPTEVHSVCCSPVCHPPQPQRFHPSERKADFKVIWGSRPSNNPNLNN